jgi:hypothetical protein
MADMLAGLESVLSRTAGIAERLRSHIERIDRVMEEAAREREGRGVVHALTRVDSKTNGRNAESLRDDPGPREDSRSRIGRGVERPEESATRGTTLPLPPAPVNAVMDAGTSFTHDSLRDVDTSYLRPTGEVSGFDLTAIDFDAYAMPTAHSVPADLHDSTLLPSLANSAVCYSAAADSIATQVGGALTNQYQSGDGSEDLFADLHSRQRVRISGFRVRHATFLAGSGKMCCRADGEWDLHPRFRPW